MPKSTLPPESSEERAANISEFCRHQGPHLKYRGTITVDGEPMPARTEQVAKTEFLKRVEAGPQIVLNGK